MSYTIHFTGLICFIEQDDGSYVVALPDGRAAKDPQDPSKVLPEHDPYLIVITKGATTVNWPGNFGQDMAFLPIDPGAKLNFQFANVPGLIDDTQYKQHMYSWLTLDPDFEIANKKEPDNAIAIARLARGTFRLYRLKGADALIAQVDVPMEQGKFAKVELTVGNIKRSVEVPVDSEIVVANVSKDRIDGTGSSKNDADHFLIYYVLNTGGKPASGKIPSIDTTAEESRSRHPFLQPGRDLNVSCSPTNLP